MSEQTLKRILVAVGVLIVAYAGVAVLRSPLGTDDDEGGALGELLATLDPEQVEEVRFVRARDTVRLVRSGEGWTVNGNPADSARVARFWNDLSEPRITGPVARNPSNHPRLGVATDSAVSVVFRLSGGETRELLIGDSGPTFPSTYVRLPDRDPVQMVHADLRGAARRNVESWRDRTVVEVDTARIRTLTLDRQGGRQTLSREGDGWSVDGAPADSASVRGILGSLVRLRSTGFAPDTAELGTPDRSLIALGEGEDTLTALDLSETGGSGYRARVRGDETIYELTSYDVGRLFPDTAALRADPDTAEAGNDG